MTRTLRRRTGEARADVLRLTTCGELRRAGLRPREAAVDAGFGVRATRDELAPLGTNVFVVGSAHRGSRRTRRRLARYRVGAEGRIAHLKRSYGAEWSRLRGAECAAI